MVGSNNDLNVLQASPLFNNMLQGKVSNMSYVVSRVRYNCQVLIACIILHNMIIEEECRIICSYTTNDILNLHVVIQVGSPAYFIRVLEIQNYEKHHNLHHDLTEHIWKIQFQGRMTMKTTRMRR
uniref:Uncharacterized protein n=1 Tax=Lactuca sativa TaxID=4236 RepID=A0A9R1UDI0_LACSA|nr:hypothetical protein LSAT_V11C900469670 [Lactuca sativa]